MSAFFSALDSESVSDTSNDLPEWANVLAIGSPILDLGLYYFVVKSSRFLLATPAEISSSALNRFYKQALRFIRSETEFLLCLGLVMGMIHPFYQENPRILEGWHKIVATLSGFVITETGLKLLTALSDAYAQQEQSPLTYFKSQAKEILLYTPFGSALSGTLASALLSMNPQWLKAILDGDFLTIAATATGIQFSRYFLPTEVRVLRYLTAKKNTPAAIADEESQTLLSVAEEETISISASLMWILFGTFSLMGTLMAIAMASQKSNTLLTENDFDTSATAGIESAIGGAIGILAAPLATGISTAIVTRLNPCGYFSENTSSEPPSTIMAMYPDVSDIEATGELDSDDEQFVKDTKRVATQGDANAHYSLGIHYMTHRKLLNYAKAHSHLKAAWDNHIKRAGSYLGLLYEHISLKKEQRFMGAHKSPLDIALYLYQHADQNYTLNQVILSVCYLRKLIPTLGYMNHAETAAKLLSAASSKEEESEDNYVNVLAFLEGIATHSSNIGANLFLALTYRYALLGVTANPSQATLFEQKVRESTEADTQYHIGLLYQKDYWVHKDPEKGLEWIKLAAAQNHSDALFNLGIVYRTGLGCTPNLALAEQYLKKAAELGHSMALSLLEEREDSSSSRKLNAIKTKRKSKQPAPTYSSPVPTPSLTQYLGNIRSHSPENLAILIHDKIAHTEELRCVRVKYTLEADSLDKLPIKKNEVLFVLRDEGKWLYCQNEEGRRGMVPLSYLKNVTEQKNPRLKYTKSNISHTIKPIDSADIEIGEALGAGNSAVVNLGFWRSHMIPIAIKRLQPGVLEDAKILEEHQRELEVMASFRHNPHPNIITFYGCTNEKIPGFIMEYMKKGPLWNYLGGREDPSSILLTLTQCAKIAVNIINGLSYLHDNDILHRDIKSLNILLDYFSGEEFFAKLIDFGTAVYCKKGQTVASTQPVGSIRWQAPEVLCLFMKQLYPHSICDYGESTDIFSYGMVLWELYTQQQPYAAFQDETNLQVIEHVAVQNKREMIPPEMPVFLKSLIQGCWQTDAKERPTAEICFKLLDAQFSANKDAPWQPCASSSCEAETEGAVSEIEIASDQSGSVHSSSLRDSFFYHKPPRGRMVSLPEPRKLKHDTEEKGEKRAQSAALAPKRPGSPR